MLQTNNWKEFVNSKLKLYIEGIGVDHIFRASYHPQSQGAIEALNKIIQIKNLLLMIMSSKKKWIGFWSKFILISTFLQWL